MSVFVAELLYLTSRRCLSCLVFSAGSYEESSRAGNGEGTQEVS